MVFGESSKICCTSLAFGTRESQTINNSSNNNNNKNNNNNNNNNNKTIRSTIGHPPQETRWKTDPTTFGHWTAIESQTVSERDGE